MFLICNFLLLVCLTTVVKAKYVISNEFSIANINIDRTKPKIELIDISNSNKGYEAYANKEDIITLKVRITDKNFKNVYCDRDHVKFRLNDSYIQNLNLSFSKIKDEKEEKIYSITIKNIEENGKLIVEFIEGTAVDTGGLINDNFQIDTKIMIDNIAPIGNFEEQLMTQGKSKGIVELSEEIRTLEGWKFSNNNLKIEKEFTNNISYELPIFDYAGNKSIVNIDILKATYINLIYASHNSLVGWTFGYGNYDVAGKMAVNQNKLWKTEALAFNIEGNISKDFVEARAYVYTHWGEGSSARCLTSNMIYNYGYNPKDGKYKSMNSTDLVTIENKKYFQFGGSGINAYEQTDINGNGSISAEVAHEFRYGISGITMRLKDYSSFSIVYQILVCDIGWTQAYSDGEECMYNKTKPMSAFRIALVPKTEKQYVLDTWNKDKGTFNL